MINDYFQIHKYALNIFLKNIDTLISKYKGTKKECIMFGTSIIAEMVVDQLKDTELKISFIIDNAKSRQGMEVYGKKVYAPERLKAEYNDNYLILIASSFQDEMIKQLESYGYMYGKHIVKIIDLPELMNDYSYVDRTGLHRLSQDEVKKVQLNILKKLKECSIEYGIRYYLHAGTALGAVRHRGYIPWDDDVDVFVPIDDYLKLIHILENDKRYKIISQFNTDYYYGWGFGYMIDCNTICDVNKFPIQISLGQSIDLFPLYGIPEDEREKDIYINTVKNLESKCLISIKDEDRINAINKLNKFLLNYNYNECKLVGNVLMPAFVNDIYEKDILGNGLEMQFENLLLNIPEKYDLFLKQLYGDYMQLPPVEKRIANHTFDAYYKEENK